MYLGATVASDPDGSKLNNFIEYFENANKSGKLTDTDRKWAQELFSWIENHYDSVKPPVEDKVMRLLPVVGWEINNEGELAPIGE